MAANDDDAAEPLSAMQPPLPTAGVVGLADVETETVTLLLELLGWSIVTAPTIEALPDSPHRLVFIDESLFMSSPMGSEPKFADWENIVVVGPPSSSTFIGTKSARIYRADLPLDIAHLETLVTNAC
jgi:hypothetical protein